MNVIHHNKEQKKQRTGWTIKKVLLMITGVSFLVLSVTLVAFHVQHEILWSSYEQVFTQKEKAQASMLELSEELDTLIVDEQTCLSNVNDSTFCSAAIESSQKAHETAKKIESREKIAQPKTWIYSADLVEKIRTAIKQVQADKQECILLNKEIKQQIKNLKAAYLDKALNDYTSMYSTMQTTVETLQALIDSTQGTVIDDIVRQDAQTTITTVQEILNTDVDEKNLEELRTATSKLIEQQNILGEKSTAITSSRDAWQAEQDRIAQQAAAAAEAERQAASRAYNNGSTYNSSNSSSGTEDYSQGNPDDSPTTWSIPDELNEGRDIPLPEGFIPYG
ncbi:hypothetical protein KP756_00680 [Streptococcus equi subsp. zooepidemicus]|uniref:hypothetical protein n=1 Tax=Streptococcus equi TaxID=1336 RepID=UPI001E4EEA97|nr:hypothetical protein [Streptococcus equi]MCD3369054.1 hypothetical protein [Streptococcus equi subsp. zooepidemicus]